MLGRVALCIHAFYPDIFSEILDLVPRSAYFLDYYVTCTEDNEEEVREIIRSRGLQARLLVCENKGMDVIPFLKAVKHFDLTRYDSIIKLHTKNHKTLNGRLMFREMMRRVIQNGNTIHELRNIFATNESVVLAGADYFYKHANYMMYNNRSVFRRLLTLFGRDRQEDVGFFAGTVFWIRGAVLAPVVAALDELLELLSQEASKSRTGADGSIAHALERIWGALPDNPDPKVVLLYPADAADTRDVIRVVSQRAALTERLRRVSVGDTLLVLKEPGAYARTVARSDVFDPDFYATQLQDCPNPGMEPALHYVLYGEPLGKKPGPTFSPGYYRLRRPDVQRTGMSLLFHYVNFRAKEKLIGDPTLDDWYALAEQRGLFDPTFYTVQRPLAKTLYPSAVKHYREIGRYIDAATSRMLCPTSVPSVNRQPLRDPLAVYLDEFHIDEGLRYNELARIVNNNDFEILGPAVREIAELYGETSTLKIARALHLAYVGRVAEAGVELESFWSDLKEDRIVRRHIGRITSFLRRVEPGGESWTPPARPRGIPRGKVCIYTTLFGGIDKLPPILVKEPGVDYICFTDHEEIADGWERRPCEPAYASLNLSAKIYKVLPHRFLAEYDYSMFVDANTVIAGRMKDFIGSYLIDRDFAMWAHPERTDPYIEMCSIVEAERHEPTALVEQMQAYSEAGLPREAGMYEASFIWRRHGAGHVVTLMESWWDEINAHSVRDQLSLSYLTWKTGLRPAVIDDRFGNSRANSFFFKVPHLRKGTEVDAPAPAAAVRTRRSGVVVLYSEKSYKTGSNILRGQQLAELIARNTDVDVAYSPVDTVHDRLVIATKGYVAERGAEGIAALKARGNTVLLDLVDARPNEAAVQAADGLIASSINAVRSYRMNWAHKEVFHVTHHVDLRLDGKRASLDHCEIGYFGEILNTITDDDLARDISFVKVDTSYEDERWIARLPAFNCHYAVRKTRDIDGSKPFLKGFVAARYRCNMIIQRGAGDADLYLGPDYPFLLPPDPKVKDIAEMIAFAKECYGGPEWVRGLAVMRDVRHRSDLRFVGGEIRQMLKATL